MRSALQICEMHISCRLLLPYVICIKENHEEKELQVHTGFELEILNSNT